MRFALILAGGSGVRLWPMSRQGTPKQLIPFVGGKSLLRLAWERVTDLVEPRCCYVGAGLRHREAVLDALPELDPDNFIGEPEGRDTLNAIGLGSAVIGRRDPDAAIAVFPADHIISPAGEFREIVASGFRLVEKRPETLVTFGIQPSFASTGFGYLELGQAIEGTALKVEQFREKPDPETAARYYAAGPGSYLWNSGMFVWRAATVLDCIRRYEPDNFGTLSRIAEQWDGNDRDRVLADLFPRLRKVSVDYAVMEPASRDSAVRVAAIPMQLQWLDVGSWITFAKTCPSDEAGNALAAGRAVIEQSANTLVASSDPHHLVAVLGCENLIVVHTPDATLVCRADRAESIKALQQTIAERFGGEYL